MNRTEKYQVIDRCLNAICEAGADEDTWASLNTLLDEDPDAQQYYLEQIDLVNVVRWQVASEATVAGYREIKARGIRPDSLINKNNVPVRSKTLSLWRPVAAIAAVLLLSLFAGYQLLILNKQGRAALAAKPIKNSSAPLTVAMENVSSQAQPKATVSQVKPSRPNIPVATAIAAVREKGEAAIGVITFARGAAWQGVPLKKGTPFGVGQLLLDQGVLRLRLNNAVELAVQAPASIEFKDQENLSLSRGMLVANVSPQARGFAVHAGQLKVVDLGTEFGLHTDAQGNTHVVVFRGEVRAEVASRLIGLRQDLHLTRDEGLLIDKHGALTSSIMGAGERFAMLRLTQDIRIPTVTNASFEYPQSNGRTTLAAAGWTLVAHPVANADAMDVKAGVLDLSAFTAKHESEFPEPPSGKQWAYLNARRYPDGRSVYTSMHQSIGLVVSEATYQVTGVIGRPKHAKNQKQEGGFSIGLFAGSRNNGPVVPIQVWRKPVWPQPGTSQALSLRCTTPLRVGNRHDELFLVLQAEVGNEAGHYQVLIDDLRVTMQATDTEEK